MKKWILTTSFQNPHSGTDSLFSGTPSKPFKVVFQAHLNRVNGRRNKIFSIYVHCTVWKTSRSCNWRPQGISDFKTYTVSMKYSAGGKKSNYIFKHTFLT